MSTIKVNTIQNSSGVEQYTCKAWVNFNGTGTVAIRASGNVASITDSGVGSYQVNFTTAMPDANYTQVSSAGTSGTAGGNWISPYFFTNTVNACNIVVFTTNFGATLDLDVINVAIFR